MEKIKKIIKTVVKEVMAEPQSIELIKKERQEDLEREEKRNPNKNNSSGD